MAPQTKHRVLADTLFSAIATSKYDGATFLLTDIGKNEGAAFLSEILATKTVRGRNALMMALDHSTINYRFYHTLVSCGALHDAMAKDDQHNTLLHYATNYKRNIGAQDAYIDLLDGILKQGVDILAVNDFGDTACSNALRNDEWVGLLFFLRKNPALRDASYGLLTSAVRHQAHACIEKLVDAGVKIDKETLKDLSLQQHLRDSYDVLSRHLHEREKQLKDFMQHGLPLGDGIKRARKITVRRSPAP